MASQVFDIFKFKSASALLDWSSDTIKAALVMTNTTVDTDNPAIAFVGDFGTLDEMDGSGYSRQTLGTKSVNNDTGNNRTNFKAADLTFASLGAGTRSIQGILIFKFVTNDAASIPIAYLEFGTPKVADGSTFVVQFTGNEVLRLT